MYSNVYRLIELGATKYAYNSVDLSVKWAGQVSDALETSESLNFRSSLETGFNHIRRYEDAGIPYDILGRSFGTYVALKVAKLFQPKLLSRLILWGIPPFWRMWQIYIRDFDITFEVAKTKGVLISHDSFSSLEPVEPLICDVTYPTIIASGTADIYSTPEDIASFRALTNNSNIEFRKPVKGAPHEVTDKCPISLIEEYFKVLFK